MPDTDRLWELVSECTRRRGRGEAPTPADLAPHEPHLWDRLAGLIADTSASVVPPVTPPDAGPLPTSPPDFTFEKLLGSGSFGEVYLACQTTLGRPVAVKLLHRHLCDADTRRRFLLEGEALAAVRHPNVAQVFAGGTHAGRPFLAMEHLPGGTLADRLTTQGGLPARKAAEWVARLAAGVHAVHAAGIIHRDLKPANVLFDEADTLKVADFGLARRADASQSADRVGSPAYMAPEQAADPPGYVGPAADVWALGVMLYECLTGGRPFGGSSGRALADVQSRAPIRPRAVRRDVPPDLEQVCLKCLEKTPTDRYPTAQALADDLERFLAGRPVLARPLPVPQRAARWVIRNPLQTGMATAVIVALVAAVGLLLSRVEQARAEASRLAAETRATTAERDKVAADLRTQEELAATQRRQRHRDALANAALALQRGQLRQAVTAIDSVAASGGDVPDIMRVERARALLGMGDQSGTRAALDSINSALLPTSVRASWHLLNAEHLIGEDDARAAAELREALAIPGLSEPEKHFAAGLTAKTAPNAHAHFAAAHAARPTYLSARLMDMLTLLSLGRLEELIDLGRGTQLLYPDDSQSALLMAVAHGMRGQLVDARRFLPSIRNQLGKDVSGIVETVLPLMAVLAIDHGLPGAVNKQSALVQQFLRDNLLRLPQLLPKLAMVELGQLGRSAATRFPPSLRPAFDFWLTESKQLGANMGRPVPLSAAGFAKLENLCRTHPEGMLLTLYANELCEREVYPHMGVPTADGRRKLREAANKVAAVYEQAATCPGRLLNTKLIATDCAIMFRALAGVGPAGPSVEVDRDQLARSMDLLRSRWGSESWLRNPPIDTVQFVRIALKSGYPGMARDLLDEARRRNPKNSDVWLLQALTEVELGNFHAALEAIRQCRERKVADPSNELPAVERRCQEALELPPP